jgi:hypothetical protein
LLGAGGVTFGEAIAMFAAVTGQAYREFIAAPTLVSGHGLVAIAVLPSREDQLQDALQIYFPNAYRGRLTVELSTADGYLRGEGAFEGDAPDASWATVSLATSRDAKVQAARTRGGPETLTVAARRRGAETPYVVAWGPNAPSRDQAVLRLYVNSRRADMLVRVEPKGTLVECKPIVGMTPVRFDRVCDFAASRLPKDRAISLIRRDGFETETKTVTIPW